MFSSTIIMDISLSSFVVAICKIFVGTLLKCHGTSNSPTTAVMHIHSIGSTESLHHSISFKICMYASKFYMVILDTCLDGMGGFQDSRMYDVPT